MMAQKTARLNRANILVFGAKDVGKTALIVRFITKRFIGEYDQNKESIYSHRLQTTNGEIVLEILDAASLETDDVQTENHVKWADGFLLIYSVTDKDSLSRLDQFHGLLRCLRGGGGGVGPDDSTPIVLVANKTDCPPLARRVTAEEGQGLSRRFDRPLFEISVAENPDGVAEAMEALLGQIRREFVKSKASPVTIPRSPFMNVKRVIKERIYNRSRSDSVLTHQ